MIRSLKRKHAGGDNPLQGRAHRYREDEAADEPANLRARMVYIVKTQGREWTATESAFERHSRFNIGGISRDEAWAVMVTQT